MLTPCHWTYHVEQKNPGQATLIFTVKIDEGWHLYSQHIPESPAAMQFTFEPLPGCKLVGITEEEAAPKEYDDYLKIEILYFEKETIF